MGLEGLEVVYPRREAREMVVGAASERVAAAEEQVRLLCVEGYYPTKSLKELKAAVRAELLEELQEMLLL